MFNVETSGFLEVRPLFSFFTAVDLTEMSSQSEISMKFFGMSVIFVIFWVIHGNGFNFFIKSLNNSMLARA